MSKDKKNKKLNEKKEAMRKLDESPKVKMKFSRDMIYNDPKKPLYEAGKIYDVEPKMVDRWLKRGGQIVEDIKIEEPVEPVEDELEEQDLE